MCLEQEQEQVNFVVGYKNPLCICLVGNVVFYHLIRNFVKKFHKTVQLMSSTQQTVSGRIRSLETAVCPHFLADCVFTVKTL